MSASHKLLALIALLSVGLGPQAYGQDEAASEQEAKSTLKVEDVKSTKKKGDIDNEITNARMRATSGSKSTISMSSSLGWQMGSIEKPFDEERPEIYGDPETESRTDISGSIDMRARFNKHDSMTFGTGVTILTPLQGDTDPEGSQFEVSNPSIGYSRVYKIGDYQTISSVDYSHATSSSWKDVELKGIAALGQNMLTTFIDNKLTVGTAVSLYLYNYGDDAAGEFDGRTAYKVGVYPYAEYAFSDKYSLRTVFGYMNFKHTRGRKEATLFNMDKSVSYQSIGVGMAITRDVYIYPNIQFLPDDFASDKTNLAISTTVNLF